jgi:hypothetical protein
MGGGKGGSSGSSKTTIRYAGYIEDAHKWLLDKTKDYVNELIDDSPLVDFDTISVDAGFFGSGYVLASFPSLYDMYGKFVAGLDVDVLFTQIFEDTVNSAAINDLVEAESALLDDDISTHVIPEFEAGLHDINALQSSAFVIGKALIEADKVKAVSKFSAEMRYKLIPTATQRWQAHLEWNRGAIQLYAEMMKLFFAAKLDVDRYNYEQLIKDKLWPFTVLDMERAAVGSLTGATTTKTKGSDSGGGGGGGILGGAATGSMFGGYGAIIGGVIGGIASIFS